MDTTSIVMNIAGRFLGLVVTLVLAFYWNHWMWWVLSNINLLLLIGYIIILSMRVNKI